MIRVAICEDELDSSRLLSGILEEYADSRKCEFNIETFINGKELLEKEIRYHIAFLDIDMPEMNGIDVGRALWRKNKKCFIIYITNLSHCRDVALNQAHSFAYLNKPLKKNQLFQQLDDLVSDLSVVNDDETIRLVTVEHGIIEKHPEDILYFEFMARKIIAYCKSGKFRIKGSNMGDLAVRLEKYGFSMSHKGVLINLQYISQIKQNDIIMANNAILPLSQKRAAAFRQIFSEYVIKGE